MEKVIHATSLNSIEDLYSHENKGQNYICASSLSCNDFMDRDVLFMLEGKVLENFYGDCGSDGNGNNMGCKDTAYDELHVSNDYEIEGLYWKDSKDIETYARAWNFIGYILEYPCEIINASQEIKEKIENFADDISEDDFLQWLEDGGIENLIV